MYASWKKAGNHTHASIMIDDTKPDAWKNIEVDAEKYGRAFASFFGPSSNALLEAAEVGNEPGKYDDATYRRLFESMAKGLRAGDPKMQIATCAVTLGKSHAYAKSVTCFSGLDALWDILNIHVYAEVEPWPTWRRSFPEDPATKFVKTVTDALEWRDKNAAGKPLWVTEFGYDASTQPPPKSGDFAKWQGNTAEQQAEWIALLPPPRATRCRSRAPFLFQRRRQTAGARQQRTDAKLPAEARIPFRRVAFEVARRLPILASRTRGCGRLLCI